MKADIRGSGQAGSYWTAMVFTVTIGVSTSCVTLPQNCVRDGRSSEVFCQIEYVEDCDPLREKLEVEQGVHAVKCFGRDWRNNMKSRREPATQQTAQAADLGMPRTVVQVQDESYREKEIEEARLRVDMARKEIEALRLEVDVTRKEIEVLRSGADDVRTDHLCREKVGTAKKQSRDGRLEVKEVAEGWDSARNICGDLWKDQFEKLSVSMQEAHGRKRAALGLEPGPAGQARFPEVAGVVTIDSENFSLYSAIVRGDALDFATVLDGKFAAEMRSLSNYATYRAAVKANRDPKIRALMGAYRKHLRAAKTGAFIRKKATWNGNAFEIDLGGSPSVTSCDMYVWTSIAPESPDFTGLSLFGTKLAFCVKTAIRDGCLMELKKVPPGAAESLDSLQKFRVVWKGLPKVVRTPCVPDPFYLEGHFLVPPNPTLEVLAEDGHVVWSTTKARR